MEQTTRNNLIALALALIFIFGSWSRLFSLESIPPGLSQDEAFNSISAAQSLASGEYHLFYYQYNWALTGPFIWLTALSMDLFGERLWAIRLVPALAGVLTLVAFLGLLQEYWRGHRQQTTLVLLSLALLAVSYWHMHTTRLHFNGTYAPLCEVLALWSLLVALRQKTAKYFVLAGTLLASGVYSYWQYVPFMLLPVALIVRAVHKRELPLKSAAIYGSVFLICLIPFAKGAMERDIFYRITQLMVMSRAEKAVAESPLDRANTFIERIRRHTTYSIAMLFARGDGNWRHNYNAQASLGLLTQFGLLMAVIFIRKRGTRYFSISHKLLWLWLWFVLALLPAIVANQGVPHSWRSNCLILPICMLAAIGMHRLWDDMSGRLRPAAAGLLLLMLVWSAYDSNQRYFFEWGTHMRTVRAFDMRYATRTYDGAIPLFETYPFIQEALALQQRIIEADLLKNPPSPDSQTPQAGLINEPPKNAP